MGSKKNKNKMTTQNRNRPRDTENELMVARGECNEGMGILKTHRKYKLPIS